MKFRAQPEKMYRKYGSTPLRHTHSSHPPIPSVVISEQKFYLQQDHPVYLTNALPHHLLWHSLNRPPC